MPVHGFAILSHHIRLPIQEVLRNYEFEPISCKNPGGPKKAFSNVLISCFCILVASLASRNNWKTLAHCKLSSLKASLFLPHFDVARMTSNVKQFYLDGHQSP